jgi:hypothetical protein
MYLILRNEEDAGLSPYRGAVAFFGSAAYYITNRLPPTLFHNKEMAVNQMKEWMEQYPNDVWFIIEDKVYLQSLDMDRIGPSNEWIDKLREEVLGPPLLTKRS